MKASLEFTLHRNFIPKNLTFERWADASKYFDQLEARPLDSYEELVRWLKDTDELVAAIEETGRRLYVASTCDTTDERVSADFQRYNREFKGNVLQAVFKLGKRLLAHPQVEDLPEEYDIYLRSIRNDQALFNEANIALKQELHKTTVRFHKIKGSVEVDLDGQQYSVQQLRKMGADSDRDLRKRAHIALAERELQDVEALEDLFDEQLALRQKMAENAGYSNYLEFGFADIGRFDYGPSDCKAFHSSIEKQVLPLLDELMVFRKEALGLEELRPWDLSASVLGELKDPFEGVEELVDKTIACLSEVKPYFGHCLQEMRDQQHLDLGARKGKAPGGYNMRMPECRVPFIFMNSVGTSQDVRVMHHEAGHAVHAFLSADLELAVFANYTAEMAELAAMTMELFALEESHKVFYKDPSELRKAKYAHLSKIVQLLCWVAVIDGFQHWLYTNPGHSREERKAAWLEISSKYRSKEVNNDGLQKYSEYQWHRQLHIFLSPLYYIEYGIAQLGAIAMWKQYCADSSKAVASYCEAMKLGYTKTLPELYKTAGISFDFTEAYISDLMHFLKAEINNSVA